MAGGVKRGTGLALLGRGAFILIAVLALVLGYHGINEHLEQLAQERDGQDQERRLDQDGQDQDQEDPEAVAPAREELRRGRGDILYYDLQLFILDSPPVDQGTSLPFTLELARFLAPLATGYALSATAYGLLVERARAFRARRSFGHTIVCGTDPTSAFLTRELVADGHKVVVVAATADEPTPGALRKVLRVVGDATNENVLRRAGADCARDVMAITGDGVFNAEVAKAVDTMVLDGAWWGRLTRLPPDHRLVCHVEIEERSAVAELAAMALSGGSDRSGLELFSRHDRAARRILDHDDWPLFPPGGGPPALLVVGSGPLAEALVTEALRRWVDHDPQVPVRIRVAAAEEAVVGMRQRIGTHPGLDWRRVEFPVTRPDDVAVGTTDPQAPTHVFVCADIDAVGYRFGRNLAGVCSSPVPVVVTASQSIVFGDRRTSGGRPALYNVTEAVFTPDSVRRGDIEDIARAIHQSYLELDTDSPAAVRWKDLPEDKREDNRAQARDIGRKLAAIGCVAVPSDRPDASFEFLDGEILPLAIMEHERWMNARLAQGWQYDPKRDDLTKRHDNIVPWAQLTPDVQAIDVAAIRNTPRVLARAGFTIVRSHTAAVLPDARSSGG